MRHLITAIFYENIPYKVIAIIFGIAFWLIGSSITTLHLQLDVPVCFYNQNNTIPIQAPETIMIHLAASRQLLSMIDLPRIAVHIDCATLRPGPCSITITAQTLLLPENIRVVAQAPCNIVVGQSEA